MVKKLQEASSVVLFLAETLSKVQQSNGLSLQSTSLVGVSLDEAKRKDQFHQHVQHLLTSYNSYLSSTEGYLVRLLKVSR